MKKDAYADTPIKAVRKYGTMMFKNANNHSLFFINHKDAFILFNYLISLGKVSF